MKNRPKARLLRIESMGNELVSLNIMADSVGQEVRSLGLADTDLRGQRARQLR